MIARAPPQVEPMNEAHEVMGEVLLLIIKLLIIASTCCKSVFEIPTKLVVQNYYELNFHIPTLVQNMQLQRVDDIVMLVIGSFYFLY